jgi:hypothetical protein
MIPPDGEKILLQHFTIFDALIYLKIYDTRTAICKYDDKMPQGIAGVCSSCLCYMVRGYEYGDTDTMIRENGIFRKLTYGDTSSICING